MCVDFRGPDGTQAPKLLHDVSQVVGVDVGLTHVAMERDGRKTYNPRCVTRAQRNVHRKQRRVVSQKERIAQGEGSR